MPTIRGFPNYSAYVYRENYGHSIFSFFFPNRIKASLVSFGLGCPGVGEVE